MKTDSLQSDAPNEAEGQGLPTLTCCASSILRLTLKKQWFDLIASDVKKEEYREAEAWILSRILGREYEVIEFKNGYGANVPTMIVEYLGCRYGKGTPAWGAKPEKSYAVLKLGKILSLHNVIGMASPLCAPKFDHTPSTASPSPPCSPS